MKAIRIHQHGGPEVLKIEEIPVPKPLQGEVLVKIHAAAMNHMDIWVRQGMPGVKIPLPIILGCEGAGVIEGEAPTALPVEETPPLVGGDGPAVGGQRGRMATRAPMIEECGPGVRHFKKGDEVILNPGTSCGQCDVCLDGNDHYCRHYEIYGENRDGMEAEYKVVPERDLLPKPKNISFEEAAAVPLTFLTAWQMLVDRGAVEAGKQVLILAASSGVGSAGVQIAKLFGARVIATVGDDKKFEKIRKLGADEVINHRKQDFAEEVRRLTNKRGVDIVFEHVGLATWEKSLKSLAFGGRLITCGATTGYDVKIDLRHLFIKQQQIIGSTMGPKSSLLKILKLIGEKKLSAVIDRIFPFSEIRQAHSRLEERAPMGKIVLIP